MTSATAASTFSVALALSILMFPAGSVRTTTLSIHQRRTGWPQCAIFEERAQEHRVKMVQYLTRLISDRQELTDELKAFMDDEIAAARDDQTTTLFEEYRVDNFYQLIQLQLWLLTKSDTIIKRCRHCGRLFVADRLSLDYCSRVAEGETEPCDVIGPKKAFSKLMDEDHISRLVSLRM